MRERCAACAPHHGFDSAGDEEASSSPRLFVSSWGREATEQRKEEHEDFVTYSTQNAAATQLIEKAPQKIFRTDEFLSWTCVAEGGRLDRFWSSGR